MKHNSKRFLSLLLALVMVIGLMPMSHVHAEDATLQMISEQVTSVEENATYVIALAGTTKALTNGDGRTDWGHHTMLLSDFGVCADATNLWTLESAEGGFKLKNANGYLAISRNAGSLDENGHVFELVYQEGQGWTIKSLESNEYCNNLGGYNSCIGGWSGDGTKFDLYSVVEVAAEEIDPFGKLRGFWSKVSVDTETSYDWKEGLFEYAFDSNPATIWHSNWLGASDKLNGSNTFAGVIDFGAVYTINQFSFTPRVGNASGQVTQASLYVKETEEAEWILVAEHATFEANGDKKDMDFDAQPVRFVKFVAEQSNDGWVAVSEFDVAYFAPEHEHVYEAVVTAPTCAEGGYTTYTCECGESYIADEVEALGHDWKGTSCTRCDAKRENPFTDVPEGSFYIDPVLWAVEKGITTGATATTFNPNGDCQRAAVVTFLWRAAGSPEPTSTTNPFTDVPADAFYYKAVLWAVEQKITNGLTATTFGPFALCNRAQVVTFLYRAMGNPEVTSTENPFQDVDASAWYGPAVLWAVENGITNGMSTTSFGVNTTCNRAQVVTFLYRTYN